MEKRETPFAELHMMLAGLGLVGFGAGEETQARGTLVVGTMERESQEEWLRGLGFFRLQKRRLRGHLLVFHSSLAGGGSQGEAGLCSQE